MASCDVYWKNVKVGSGTATKDSATISAYTAAGVGLAAGQHGRRNLKITATSGTNVGETFRARCVTDNTTSLVLDRAYGWAT